MNALNVRRGIADKKTLKIVKPSEIKWHTRSQELELGYADGTIFKLGPEFLRVYSPSAEVRGHSPAQAKLQYGKQQVTIRGVEAQGNYAIRLEFSDGHDSGIYSWDYLYELASNQESLWQEYLKKLAAEGKSRLPTILASSKDP